MFAWLQSIYAWVFASHALLVQIRATQLAQQKQLDAIAQQSATLEKSVMANQEVTNRALTLANRKLDQLVDLLTSHNVTELNITVDKPVSNKE